VTTPSEARFRVESGAYDRPGEAIGPAPMELLLSALVTCAGSTIDSVLEKMRFEVAGLNVVADADRSDRVPRVYTKIDLDFQIASEAPEDRLLHAIEVTERTCSVSVMLADVAPISARLVQVRQVEPAVTRPLRQQMLRPHQSLDELVSPGESAPGAVWFAAIRDGEVVGTAGLIPEPAPDLDVASPLRLRAMATSASQRGRGLGKLLLDAALAEARAKDADVVWCSARTSARDFYTVAGFVETSETYDEDHIGPHVRMALTL
jgi:uncharacterized OsmC-like protein/predicted GNAT family N-acyltransferase